VLHTSNAKINTTDATNSGTAASPKTSTHDMFLNSSRVADVLRRV
jgi:hypothetical protein